MAETSEPESTPDTIKTLRTISKNLGGLVLAVGFLVIIGWIFNITVFKSIRSDTVPMNPVTAICFMMAGLSLILVQESMQQKYNREVKILAIVLILIDAIKLFSIITGLHIPLDHVLFREKLWSPILQDYHSIAPNTAINFVLVGFALLYIDRELAGYRRPAQYLGIVITLLSLLSLYGYLYGIKTLYSVKAFIPMAIHTAFCFLLLGAGILFARPNKGSMAVVIGENSGQIIFMRFVAFLLPLVYGWLKIQGENVGWFSKEFGTALFAIITYSVSMFFLARQSVLQHKIRETRRKAVEIIKENERRLQAILDHSAANISLKTPLGKYTLVNKQFEKDFNLETGHIIGKTDYDLFPQDFAKELNQYDHEIIKTGEPKSFEEKYPQKDGIHTYLTVKFPLLTQDQKIYALGAVSTDITKRKHLEDELRKSHQRLFGILDNLGEGVIVADADGNLIIFNRRAEEIMGSGSASASWKEWNHKFEFLHKDGLTPFQKIEMPLYLAMKGDASNNVEMLIRSENLPEGRWLAVSGRPVKNELQQVIAGVIVFRDITFRKALENLFSENDIRLKMILASIGEGVIILDKDQKPLLLNQKALEILGNAPKNIPVTDWPRHFGIYTPDGETLFPGPLFPLTLALKGIEAKEQEVVIRNEKWPDGRNAFLSARPINNAKGELTGAILDFKDITQQRKLEEYLQEIEAQIQNLMDSQRPTT